MQKIFMRKWLSIFLLLLNPFTLSACLADDIKVSTLHQGDAEYQYVSNEFKREGVVTKIISADTPGGQYYFVFLEQRLKKTVHTGDETTLYGLKRNGEWGEIRKTKDDDNTDIVKNIRAYVLLADHGGYVQKQKFQDFGNEVYWPGFIYPDCFIMDADGDGEPEFYLTYFADSDGMDPKPLKVIVYNSHQKTDGKFLKAKATAFYPAGNEDDVYHVEYDESWLALPEAIKKAADGIIKKHRNNEPVLLDENG